MHSLNACTYILPAKMDARFSLSFSFFFFIHLVCCCFVLLSVWFGFSGTWRYNAVHFPSFILNGCRERCMTASADYVLVFFSPFNFSMSSFLLVAFFVLFITNCSFLPLLSFVSCLRYVALLRLVSSFALFLVWICRFVHVNRICG